jgi:hypothetical protein
MGHPLRDSDLLAALRASVERARPSLDTGQGVKMLYSDVASLSNRIWTVGLNPGGGHSEPDQWHREDGAHDYRDGYRSREVAKLRPGGLKLREQLALMLAWLGVDWNETLSLNLVPFRSARWDAMPPSWRKAALAFAANDFWPLLLVHRRPRLVVSFGAEPARTLRRLLGHGEPTSYPVAWGAYTADVSATEGHAVLRLPHLSTFRIFGRRGGVGVEALARLRDDPGLRRVLAPPLG